MISFITNLTFISSLQLCKGLELFLIFLGLLYPIYLCSLNHRWHLLAVLSGLSEAGALGIEVTLLISLPIFVEVLLLLV